MRFLSRIMSMFSGGGRRGTTTPRSTTTTRSRSGGIMGMVRRFLRR